MPVGRCQQRMMRFLLGLVLAAALLLPLEMALAASELPPRVHNDLGMEFVLIPAGSFMMGSPPDEPNRDADEVQHRVVIKKPFYLQVTEVTLGQWRAIMGTPWLGRRRGRPDLPVTRVSWFDARDFIEKLNALGMGRYRLPTEAEWEYACRAGTTTAYWWGDKITCDRAMYANNHLKAWDCQDYYQKRGIELDRPAPVKTFPPNPWGLYDMPGNVWEWCYDWYGPYPRREVVDPTGPPSGRRKVRRGGSWFSTFPRLRSANRNFANPMVRYDTLGFRLVKEPPE